jgi:hypothetical protein
LTFEIERHSRLNANWSSYTILDKTSEIIPAHITKLLNIDKINFVSPPPPSSQVNDVNNADAKTTFGNLLGRGSGPQDWPQDWAQHWVGGAGPQDFLIFGVSPNI